MRRKVTKQMLAAGLTVIMLFSALFPVNAFALGRQGNMAGIEGTVPAQAAQDAPEYYAFLRNLKVLEGYALCLLSEDGAETELTLEGDEEETVSFTLDFTNSETPVQVIRLVPVV